METRPDRSRAERRFDEVLEALRRERRRTADELEALKTFEVRIRSIDAGPKPATGRRILGAAGATGTTGLDRVREAYEATLMSVPHYREEYDDTYVESVAEEFSPDIAAAVTDGTRFNSRCKRAILSAASKSQTARESLLGVIDRERESVDASKDDLLPLIEECADLGSIPFKTLDFGALDAYRTRLGTIRGHCRDLSDRRQSAIFDQRRLQRIPADVPDVTVYFYQDIDADYPVMSLVAELLDSIASIERAVEEAMTRCRA